jgi:hypothetical protein
MTLLPLLCLALGRQTGPVHRALIIGVSDYSNATGKDGIFWPDLTCTPDVTALKAALISSGEFKADDIHTLSGTVTRSQAVAELRWLVSDGNPKSVLFFHFSGHGYATQKKITGLSGTGNRDNGLVFSDSKGGEADHMLMSSDLAGVLNSAKSENVLATLDACQTGGMTRGIGGRYHPRGFAAFDPPEDTPFMAPSKKVVVFSAAQFNQEANEDKGGGAFSNALAHAYAGLKEGDGVTYRDLFETVDASMRATADLNQNPVPAGDLDRAIFTGQHVEARSYFPVRVQTRNGKPEIVIEAGQVHRLTPGSEIAIYREDVSGAPVAFATVTDQVGVAESVLTVKPGFSLGPQEGDKPYKGVVTQLAAGDGVLSLLEDSSCQGRSADWFAKLPQDQPIKLVPSGDYDLKLLFANSQWALQDADGEALDSQPDSDVGRGKIEDRIGQVSRWKSIKHLENSLGSQVKVSLRLRHVETAEQDGLHKFTAAVPLGTDEQHFEKGEFFAVQVCAKPAQAGQAAWQPSIAVLELKANHGVQQLWPEDLGAQDKYRLPLDGQWHWLGQKLDPSTGQTIEAGFVDSAAGSSDVEVFQFLPALVPGAEELDVDGVGAQTFKVMATKDSVDYRGLLDTNTSRGIDTAAKDNSPLGKLIARYSLGTRGPAVTGPVAAKEWATNSFTAINTKG